MARTLSSETRKQKRRVKYEREKAARAVATTSTSTSQSTSDDGSPKTVPTKRRGRPPNWVPPLKRKKQEREEKQAVSVAARSRLRSAATTNNNEEVEEDVSSPQLRTSTRSMSSSKTISPEENAKTPAIQRKSQSQRTTRSTTHIPTLRILPDRNSKVQKDDIFDPTFQPGTNKEGHDPWSSTKKRIDNLASDNKKLLNKNAKLEKEIRRNQNEINRLNYRLLKADKDVQGDYRSLRDTRDEWDDRSDSPTKQTLTGEEVKKLLKNAFSAHRRGIADDELRGIFTSLGLNNAGALQQHDMKKESIAQCIRVLFDVHFSNYDENERADIMGEMMFNSTIFSKEASQLAAVKATRSITSCIFNVVQLLKVIDMKAGSLNDSATDEYAQIEDDVKLTTHKKGYGILRKRNHITRARAMANRLVDELFTIDEDLNESSNGDMVCFEPTRMFRWMIKTFRLEEKARQGKLLFAGSGDAAAVCTSTNNAGQCLVGLKIIDDTAIHPLTGEPMICKVIEDNDVVPPTKRKVYHGAQSPDCCIVTGGCMMGEKEALNSKVGKSLFDLLKKVEKDGLEADGDEEGYPPQTGGFCVCGDMSFHQKISGGMGGGCKVKEFFCIHCEARSLGDHDLLHYVTGEHRCARCVRNNRDKCAHRDVNDTKELHRKGVELQWLLLEDFRRTSGQPNATLRDMMPEGEVECLGGYDEEGQKTMEKCIIKDQFTPEGDLVRSNMYDYLRPVEHSSETKQVREKCKIRLDVNAVDKSMSTTNIDYVVDGTVQSRDDAFNRQVTKDLRQRGYTFNDIPQDAAERVSLLRKCLHTAEMVRNYRNALTLNEDALGTQILNPGFLPCCILHAKMRMTEKIIQQLILCGMRDHSSGNRFVGFCKRVEHAVNTNIFGRNDDDNGGSSGWKVPIDKKDKNKLGDVKLSGPASTTFLSGLDHLVDVCTSEHSSEFRDEWKKACNEFRSVMGMLESREEFTTEQVDEFQLKADEFCDVYFALTGKDGMTNYFHNLRSGHFSYFLDKYGNLYKLSQQGWENVNSCYKRSFHNNSQKGGGRGGSSKLRPVMYTMTRAMLWRYGYLEKLFEKIGHTNAIDVKYGEVKRLPQKSIDTDNATKIFAETLLKLGSFEDAFGSTEEEGTV